MGAFDRDKQFGNRLDLAFAVNVPFALVDVTFTGETIETDTREAEQVTLTVARLTASPEGGYIAAPAFQSTTIAQAIVDKLRDIDDDELPCVVELRKVPSKRSRTGEALVLQYVGPWTGTDFESA